VQRCSFLSHRSAATLPLYDVSEVFKVLFQLPTGMVTKRTPQDLFIAEFGIVTEKYAQQRRPASSLLKYGLVFCPDVSANRTPGNTMIRLKCR
jgi:hypothetical protein